MPRLRSDGARTRGRLLEAAVELVREGGWDAATTRAIAARAETPPGSVHYHFDTVDDLVFEAVSGHLAEDVTSALGDIDPDDVSHWGVTLATLATRVSDADARLWLELCLRAIQDRRVARWMRRLLDDGRAELAAALGDTDAATGLVALADGLLLHKLIDPSIDVAATFAALVPTKGNG